jgi:osmotically inducible protein OsmC
VTSSALDTSVTVPNADPAAFDKAAEAAKSGCPISKLLNARITMHARLA